MTATEKDRTSYIVQGEFRVSRDPSEVLSTVLGSCVAVCLWDPTAKVGGMNHFLLPAAPGQGDAKMLRYGAHAMEVLINEVLKLGSKNWSKEDMERLRRIAQEPQSESAKK